MGTAATAFVGIDVSKATLDACLLGPDGRAKQAAFANDADGHAALIAWADRHAGAAGRPRPARQHPRGRGADRLDGAGRAARR